MDRAAHSDDLAAEGRADEGSAGEADRKTPAAAPGTPRAEEPVAEGPDADGRPDDRGSGLRVLLVLASSGWGGTEKAFVDLANALAPRCDVFVAVPPDAEYVHRLSDEVSAVRRLRAGSRRNPIALRHLRRLVREVDPDVVHSHAARAAEMVYWAGWGGGPPHVATKHNTRRRWIFSRIRWVTAVSEQAAASIAARHEVEVVHNGIAPLPEPPGRASAPDPSPGAGALRLLAVGRLHPHKGFDRLVRAVAALPFDCLLTIAGEGPERSRLEAAVDDLGASGRVRLLGHREDVAALMRSSHALVVPSRTEGFSLALLEGLHACPVVLSTPVGIATEILPDALVFRPEDLAPKLHELHADYGRFVEETRLSLERLGDRFLIDRTAERYLELYGRARRAPR